MIRVVTIAREFGSGGGRIAAEVARQLDWKLLDAQLIRDIAVQAGVQPHQVERLDERVDSPLYRIVRSVWRGGFAAGNAAPDAVPFDAETMARITGAVMQQAAELGECVIVGRGGQCILQERSDTLHVFIYGPRSERLRRVRNRLPGTDAEALIARHDQDRAAWIRAHFGCDWCNRHLYHMMVSSSIGEETATRCILQAIQSGTEASRG
jgi:cytidylate kinase